MSSYDIKGIIIWIAFLAICGAIVIASKVIRKRLRDSEWETTGVISRIEEDYDAQDHTVSYHWYVVYTAEDDGREYEALLLDPTDLEPGSHVRIKYDPSNHLNVVLAEQ